MVTKCLITSARRSAESSESDFEDNDTVNYPTVYNGKR